jgi:hypothetical protein
MNVYLGPSCGSYRPRCCPPRRTRVEPRARASRSAVPPLRGPCRAAIFRVGVSIMFIRSRSLGVRNSSMNRMSPPPRPSSPPAYFPGGNVGARGLSPAVVAPSKNSRGDQVSTSGLPLRGRPRGTPATRGRRRVTRRPCKT